EGAANAMRAGKSLLPAGVKRVEGSFNRGDCVVVRSFEGGEIARGLVAYDAVDAVQIAGRSTRDIEAILGYSGRKEIIHRDDLVMSGDGAV
ncbi:MAG: PUA domain-containing protein, partial [Rhabdaerophilum sp.]